VIADRKAAPPAVAPRTVELTAFVKARDATEGANTLKTFPQDFFS